MGEGEEGNDGADDDYAPRRGGCGGGYGEEGEEAGEEGDDEGGGVSRGWALRDGRRGGAGGRRGGASPGDGEASYDLDDYDDDAELEAQYTAAAAWRRELVNHAGFPPPPPLPDA